MLRTKLLFGLIFTCLLCTSSVVLAQATWTLDPFGKEKKPEKYEEKILASEKTGEKKFGPVRRFIQNTTSHYNFYFNANNKINSVIERARIANKDNYGKLLSFYPYSLENTASQKTDLDSVIYKATAGILLHDLRTEWVDNFYLLIGKSYFLKKDFDSAALTFQFINYNLFPRKKGDDDYNRVVGTNEAGSGLGSVSIADKENRSILEKAFKLPPSRNDALIWQIRTYTEQNEFADAAGLISILQNDRNLPQRLKNDLEEVTAYWFYAQNNYDSSSVHLAKALSNADDKEDKSRREYLLAQLYEISGKFDEASVYYLRAAKHTADPVMDIYARLSDAKMLRLSGDYKELDNSIANLLKMARKDKYESYRDIIYYSTAQLSLQRPDTVNGIVYYNKSIAYNLNTSGYRDRSYLQLADIAYTQKRYKDARSFYDSLNLGAKDTEFDTKTIEERKEILSRLVPELLAVERADSLQAIAAMAPADRDALLKKMVKKYRKENGLKEEEDFAGNTIITFNDRNKAPVDLFRAAGANTGEWYFYNASLKAKGFSDFKSKWGKRTNMDNWRRRTASETIVGKNLNTNIDIDATIPQDGKGLPISADGTKPIEFSYDGLMADLPLSQELIDSSNSNIARSLFSAAQIFQNDLEDYEQAVITYEEFITRFPGHRQTPEVYFGLAYSYGKLGNTAKSNYYRSLLTSNYAGSNSAKMISNPSLLKPGEKNPEVTARYAGIYDMFIEGNFSQATAAKNRADSTFGNNYWLPQLLYIESVYYIKEKKDSNAIAVLKNLQGLYPQSPLREKAATMIDVLGRRAEIEKYLTDLQVTRIEDEKVIISDDKAPISVKVPTAAPIVVKTAPPVVIKKMSDSIKLPQVYVNKSFTLQPDAPHYVVMILDKVDAVYVNEAKNAFTRFNKGSMATLNVVISRDAIDAEKALVVFKPFDNAEGALKYFDKIKKAAPSEVSWLQPAKYSFIIISESNLQLLKTNKDITSYKQLLNANFGNRF